MVLEKHCQMQLGALGGVVGDAYLALDFPEGARTPEQIRCLAGLYKRLQLTISELMAGDGESLEQFRRLRALLARDTRLDDYFAGGDSNPKDAISLWSHRVSRAVRRLLGPVPYSDSSRFWTAAENVPRNVDK